MASRSPSSSTTYGRWWSWRSCSFPSASTCSALPSATRSARASSSESADAGRRRYPMKTDTVAAATAAIPGLVLRQYAGEHDLPDLVRIQNAEWDADGMSYRETVEERRAWYGNPSEQFQPHRDVTIAEVDGRMVGY